MSAISVLHVLHSTSYNALKSYSGSEDSEAIKPTPPKDTSIYAAFVCI